MEAIVRKFLLIIDEMQIESLPNGLDRISSVNDGCSTSVIPICGPGSKMKTHYAAVTQQDEVNHVKHLQSFTEARLL